jgi:hypothetical protein
LASPYLQQSVMANNQPSMYAYDARQSPSEPPSRQHVGPGYLPTQSSLTDGYHQPSRSHEYHQSAQTYPHSHSRPTSDWQQQQQQSQAGPSSPRKPYLASPAPMMESNLSGSSRREEERRGAQYGGDVLADGGAMRRRTEYDDGRVGVENPSESCGLCYLTIR